MELLEIHTQAENGRVSFDLPAGHAALANARLRVTIAPEGQASDATPQPGYPPTDWAALDEALTEVVKLNPYRTIADPVQWQRDLRDEWERPLPGRP